LPEVQQRIQILRADALNSVFPAWQHQRPSNQVLHLAATSSLLRRRAFEQGLATVCQVLQPTVKGLDAVSNAGDEGPLQLPRQLGLTREALLALRSDLPVEETVMEASAAVKRRLLALGEKAGGEADAAAEDITQVMTFAPSAENLLQSSILVFFNSLFLCDVALPAAGDDAGCIAAREAAEHSPVAERWE
jgi:hypothetical protein